MLTNSLQQATRDGDLETVKVLLEEKPELVFRHDSNGRSPLLAAAEQGNLAMVELLLANKANINARDKLGQTPLHIAAYYGNQDMVKLLLANNANASAEDKDGMIPMLLAVEQGHAEAAELLRPLLGTFDDLTIAEKRGNKWLGIAMLVLWSGTLADAFFVYAGMIPAICSLLACASFVLGIITLFRVYKLVVWIDIGIAAILFVLGMKTALSHHEVILAIMTPAVIVCVVSVNALMQPQNSTHCVKPGYRAWDSFILSLIVLLWIVAVVVLNIQLDNLLVDLEPTVVAIGSIIGLSFGIDALQAPNNRLAIAGVILNVFGFSFMGPLAFANIIGLLQGHQ